MLTHIRPAVVTLGLMTLLTGVAYPLAVTGIAAAMPGPAKGSLLKDGSGRVVGSALIGQTFAKADYLHGRPSAAGNGYDPTSSSGSDYGPLDPKLADRVSKDAAALAKEAPSAALPADAVTTSASGLDPDVSPAFAAIQAPRIAAARHAPAATVQAVIDGQTRGRTFLILGEPRVNVLAVNRILDAQLPVVPEMTLVTRFALFGSVLVLAAAPMAAHAQTAAPDTPGAPQAASAEPSAICTDRPTKSTAPCAVDTGHLQLESDLFNGTFLRLGGVTTDTYLVTNPTLKYGLAKNIDVEANIAPYVVVRSHDKFGGSDSLGGVGDLYLRLKWNAYNTADGKWSFAAVPYIKAPTARSGIGNGEVEGGSVFTVAYKLTHKITVTTSPEFDAFKDANGDGRHFNTIQLINVGYSLPKNVTVYGEFWGDWNHDPSGVVRQYSADAAVAWGITKTLQVDAGLNFGLNKYTPGVQAYFGASQKF